MKIKIIKLYLDFHSTIIINIKRNQIIKGVEELCQCISVISANAHTLKNMPT
jgi:hypothetical protein